MTTTCVVNADTAFKFEKLPSFTSFDLPLPKSIENMMKQDSCSSLLPFLSRDSEKSFNFNIFARRPSSEELITAESDHHQTKNINSNNDWNRKDVYDEHFQMQLSLPEYNTYKRPSSLHSSFTSTESGFSTPTQMMFQDNYQNSPDVKFEPSFSTNSHQSQDSGSRADNTSMDNSDFLDDFLNTYDDDFPSYPIPNINCFPFPPFMKNEDSDASIVPGNQSISALANGNVQMEKGKRKRNCAKIELSELDIYPDVEVSTRKQRAKRQKCKKGGALSPNGFSGESYRQSVSIDMKAENGAQGDEESVRNDVEQDEEEDGVERVKTKKGLRKRRRNEWTSEEVVLLLSCTKILINYELKTISQALFELIRRDPGKCWGRAAEKKLKRMQIFENWKTCDRCEVVKRIDEVLSKHEPLNDELQNELLKQTTKAKNDAEKALLAVSAAEFADI